MLSYVYHCLMARTPRSNWTARHAIWRKVRALHTDYAPSLTSIIIQLVNSFCGIHRCLPKVSTAKQYTTNFSNRLNTTYYTYNHTPQTLHLTSGFSAWQHNFCVLPISYFKEITWYFETYSPSIGKRFQQVSSTVHTPITTNNQATHCKNCQKQQTWNILAHICLTNIWLLIKNLLLTCVEHS